MNLMIKEAMDSGEDATGLCTVRQLAAEMLSQPTIDGKHICELSFIDEIGRRINIECVITKVDGILQDDDTEEGNSVLYLAPEERNEHQDALNEVRRNMLDNMALCNIMLGKQN